MSVSDVEHLYTGFPLEDETSETIEVLSFFAKSLYSPEINLSQPENIN